MEFFGAAIKEDKTCPHPKAAPKKQNLLPLPPNEFILQETTRVRQSQGLDAQGALHMLSQWKVRKCITNHHYRKNRTTELILTRTDKRKIYPS